MNTDKIIFPLSIVQAEFLQGRNQAAIDSVAEAVRLVSIEVNVPPGIKVAPTEDLTALVVVPTPVPVVEAPEVVKAPQESETTGTNEKDLGRESLVENYTCECGLPEGVHAPGCPVCAKETASLSEPDALDE